MYVWLELHEPGPELMAELCNRFGLHELAVEDAARAHQRPKVESYDNFYFIVYKTAHYDEASADVDFGELDLFLGPGFVIAVRHGRTVDLGGTRRRLEERPQLLKSGPAAVVWGILDAVVDDYRPVVDSLESEIEELEAVIFAGREDVTERIYLLKQRVNELYRALHPLLAPLEVMERGGFEDMDPGLRRYFRDVADHVRRMQEEVLAGREQLNGVLEANVSLISLRQNEIVSRQNEIVKQLTIVATVFLPLSFVVGFFGQNFGWLTSHIGSLTSFLALGICSLIVPALVFLAWLRGRERG
jgi:magnesium transporter